MKTSMRKCVGWALPTIFLSGCRGVHSALDPAGPQSSQISHVWWIFFWICSIVYILVVLASLFAIRRMRTRVDLTQDLIEIPGPDADRPRHRILPTLVHP